MPPPLVARYLRPRIAEALADTPVVLVNGPRQAGKTTLARQFAGFVSPAVLVTAYRPNPARWNENFTERRK